MMQTTRAEIIAVTLLTSISLTVPPAFLNFGNQAVALCSGTDYNQRPAVVCDIVATVDCLTDITTINHR